MNKYLASVRLRSDGRMLSIRNLDSLWEGQRRAITSLTSISHLIDFSDARLRLQAPSAAAPGPLWPAMLPTLTRIGRFAMEWGLTAALPARHCSGENPVRTASRRTR
jgi:hypothetical protein